MRRSKLATATLGAALAVMASGCGGGDTGSTPVPPATTGATPGDPLAAGKVVFLGISGCGGCHALAAAGSSGTVASNLDEKKPSAARVQEVVANGSGAMPSYRKQLTAQEIADVAAYVASVAGR